MQASVATLLARGRELRESALVRARSSRELVASSRRLIADSAVLVERASVTRPSSDPWLAKLELAASGTGAPAAGLSPQDRTVLKRIAQYLAKLARERGRTAARVACARVIEVLIRDDRLGAQ